MIHIVVTGGTFDKTYNELKGILDFGETAIHRMLRHGRFNQDYSVHPLFMLDSLELNDEHRETLVKYCNGLMGDKIIITHGTDTMTQTAESLAGQVKDKTVVITGAMVPYTFNRSDGLFNLGNALAYVELLSPGIYIVMNGRYFSAGTVQKNIKSGLFESKVTGHSTVEEKSPERINSI